MPASAGPPGAPPRRNQDAPARVPGFMLRSLRSARLAAGLPILALFALWLGVAELHHDEAGAPCEICKALQATPSSLPDAPPAVGPILVAGERVAPVVLLASAEGHTPLSLGRAPPLL